MNEYINRDDVRRMIMEYSADDPKKQTVWAMVISDMLRDLKEIPATDAQPVVDTENMATVSDEFICKKCGIYLKDYIKVVMDEDNDGYIDEQHYEYEPKFCPECGAKVKEGDING